MVALNAYFFTRIRQFARAIWSIIQISSGLSPPRSVVNVFGNWINEIEDKYETLFRVGALAIIWSLWLCRNETILNNVISSPLQVIYRATVVLRSWTSLQRMEFRNLFAEDCRRLEDTARDIFSRHG